MLTVFYFALIFLIAKSLLFGVCTKKKNHFNCSLFISFVVGPKQKVADILHNIHNKPDVKSLITISSKQIEHTLIYWAYLGDNL